MSVARHLERVRVRCLCRPKSGTWPRGPCGRSGGECSTSWPRVPGPMAGKQAKQASVGNVSTMRDEQAGGAVVGERIRRSRPHFTEGQTETPPVAHPCPEEKVERSEVTSSELGNLFSPEHWSSEVGQPPQPRAWIESGRYVSRPLLSSCGVCR